MIPISRNIEVISALLLVFALAAPSHAQPFDPAAHTDPINLTPLVREAHEHFYNLDYDGALSRFETVQRENPRNPMAANYVLMVLIFRELYHQDLLDTTYYAHDSFLTSKRSVPVPQATRDRIESLTNSSIAMCDKLIKADPRNKNAYFARGYARGMHAAFITLVDHSYISATTPGTPKLSRSSAAWPNSTPATISSASKRPTSQRTQATALPPSPPTEPSSTTPASPTSSSTRASRWPTSAWPIPSAART